MSNAANSQPWMQELADLRQRVSELEVQLTECEQTRQQFRQTIAELETQVANLTAALNQAQAQRQAIAVEHQQTEATLEATQTRNRAFLQAIPDLIMEISADGIYLDFIEAKNMDLLISNSQDRLGKHVMEVLPAAIAQQYLQAIQQALQTGMTQTFEYQLEIHSHLNDYEARVVANGAATALLIVRDVTERKRVERALRLEREKSERLLLNVLPQPIAERLKQQQSSIDRFDEATILFADIVDFTRLSAQLSATELVSLLNDIFSVFDDLAEQYGLEKIKTIGDAYMVVGGIPEPRTDHAVAIAEMALAMQREIARFPVHDGAPFQLRIGINTGPVVAGVIGIKKFIYDLWGDSVNVASRMESHGLAGGIQVTALTYEYLKHQYVLQERGTISVKGKGTMLTYLLTGKLTSESLGCI